MVRDSMQLIIKSAAQIETINYNSNCKSKNTEGNKYTERHHLRWKKMHVQEKSLKKPSWKLFAKHF